MKKFKKSVGSLMVFKQIAKKVILKMVIYFFRSKATKKITPFVI